MPYGNNTTDQSHFDFAYDIILQNEGGYTYTAGDKGGETYRGISRVYNSKWPGWPVIDAYKKRLGKIKLGTIFNNPALDKLVKDFYRDNYWDKIEGDSFSDPVVVAHIMDWFVNSQSAVPKRVNKALSSIDTVSQSNDINEDTIRVANAFPGQANKNIVDARIKFYNGIVASNPGQKKFLNNWLARAKSFLTLTA